MIKLLYSCNNSAKYARYTIMRTILKVKYKENIHLATTRPWEELPYVLFGNFLAYMDRNLYHIKYTLTKKKS